MLNNGDPCSTPSSDGAGVSTGGLVSSFDRLGFERNFSKNIVAEPGKAPAMEKYEGDTGAAAVAPVSTAGGVRCACVGVTEAACVGGCCRFYQTKKKALL